MKKYKIRRNILNLLAKFFFHTKEGCRYPEWILWILFPLTQYACKFSNVYIDYMKGTVRLFGVEIPISLLQSLTNDRYMIECFYNFKKDSGIMKINLIKYIERKDL